MICGQRKVGKDGIGNELGLKSILNVSTMVVTV